MQLQLTFDYNALRDLIFEKEILDDRSRKRNTHSLLLETSYDISARFSVSLLLSTVIQERQILTQAQVWDLTRNTGLGDAILLLRYNLLPLKAGYPHVWMVGLGPKAPFGRSDHTDSRGILLPADLQPGTGSWDALLWTAYTYQGLWNPTASFSLTASYQYTTASQRFGGQQQYQFGRAFQIQAGIQDRVSLGPLILDPLISLQYRRVGADEIDQIIIENTGGEWLALSPGLNINLGKTSAVRISGDWTFWRKLTGLQLSTTYRLRAAVYFLLATQPAASPFPLN
ncbi:MAG: hypothetical protein AAFR61_26385 [Bacteroidota bacterium]